MSLLIRILRQIMVSAATAAFFVACASSDQRVKSATPADPAWTDQAPAEDDDMDPSVLARFREPLAPYGRWVDDPAYGTIWIPNAEIVGPDFVPYVSAGYWTLGADDQWTWVSDYDWGWAPFHYGRWIWIDGTGWAWIPGGVYAPAWVVWRTAYDDGPYVGWAPLPPSWYWFSGVPVRVIVVIEPRFVFVPSRHVFGPNIRDHELAAPHAAAIAARSRPVVAPGNAGRYPALDQVRGPSPAVAGVPAASVPVKRDARDPRTLPPASRPQSSPSPRAPQTPSRPTPRSGGHKGR